MIFVVEIVCSYTCRVKKDSSNFLLKINIEIQSIFSGISGRQFAF